MTVVRLGVERCEGQRHKDRLDALAEADRRLAEHNLARSNAGNRLR